LFPARSTKKCVNRRVLCYTLLITNNQFPVLTVVLRV
ncbi:hypothetical protein T03_7775, partial [Trichinella britovi]